MNIAIVTGASSGMGREFVRQLHNYIRPDEIWAIARRQTALEELRAETEIPVRPVVLDLGKAESFREFSALLEAEKPNVELLVNAAGFGKFGDFEAISLEDDLSMVDLNCKALVAMTRITLPYMQRGAHILQLDSLSAFQPVPYITTYGATKAFVLSYTRSVNAELKPRGIRMMAMNPAWVKTEFFNHAFQTNNRVQYFNYVQEAKDVGAIGLKDLYQSKKDMSIPGFGVKLQVLGVKLLPHKLVMKTWMKQQKKPLNNQGLTTK